MCDEIFGEENLVTQLVWEKTRKNDARLFSIGHEYMLVFARDLQYLKDNETIWREQKPGAREILDKYQELKSKLADDYEEIQKGLREWYRRLPDSHPSKKLSRYKHIDKWGPWRDRDISWPGGGGPRYDVIHPRTRKPCAVPERGWGFSTPESMQNQIDLGLVVFREDHTQPPIRKAHLMPISEELVDMPEDHENGSSDETVGMQVMPTVIYKQAQVAIKALRKLMGGKVFDNPKDHEVLQRLIKYVSSRNDIVMDFFAGSSASAHAVLDLNKDDGGNRKFIMVQLPEPCEENSEAYAAGYKTISDIGKERIRRVINKIDQEQAAKAEEAKSKLPGMAEEQPELDLGFKVLKLDKSNFKVWDGSKHNASKEELEKQLELHIDHIDPKASQEDILFELLLKAGFVPTEKVEKLDMAGKTVFSVAEGALLICLENEITREVIDAVAEAEPLQFICLDRGFQGNDQLKANAVQTFAARNQGRDKAEQIVFRTV
jgi:adenine-specific DNA-methyltransferase